jgi:hypothetical protein
MGTPSKTEIALIRKRNKIGKVVLIGIVDTNLDSGRRRIGGNFFDAKNHFFIDKKS